jgi:16S rRNA (cytosine967-C5)-methyltransferase
MKRTPQEPNRSARAVAARVLGRVLRKAEFAAAVLDMELSGGQALSGADRALATELVYGVLRTRGALQARLDGLASKGTAGADPRVLDHLLVAAYQLSFLERVPSFAAVNEAVELVTRLRGSRVGGFCNAVLRRYAAEPRLVLAEALLQSAPTWLAQALQQAVGEAETLRLLGAPAAVGAALQGLAEGQAEQAAENTPQSAAGLTAELNAELSTEQAVDAESALVPRPAESGLSGACVRFRAGTAPPAWAATGRPGRLYPGALRFFAAGDLRRHPEYAAGGFVIQDEGSMFAAHALGVRAGERVLDACAGRGHKSSLLAEQVGQGGQLWVTDVSSAKLQALQREFARLKLPPPTVRTVDYRNPAPELPTDFDRVLVDAPCTGTGTLRKRPEIALRLTPDDVERLAVLAETLVRQAAQHVRPGGHLLFVVCSVLPRENEAIVERLADVLEPAPFGVSHPAIAPGATTLRLLPGQHGTDGFFLAHFRKR